MRTSLFFRPWLIIAYLIFSLSPAIAAMDLPHQQDTDLAFSQLYHKLHTKPISNITDRIVWFSTQFLSKPYDLGALGEGEQAPYDQFPLYRTDAFDCETYVDTVLALAQANDYQSFKKQMNQIRYQDGQVSYTQRNHFTCIDWNKNNQAQGFVKDITTTIKAKDNVSVIKFASALIDKPSWYEHMTIDTIRINGMDTSEREARLKSLQAEGRTLARSTSIIPYLPLSALFNPEGKANDYLFHQIPNAAIIEIIRPNWDLSKEIGTHLNVSHLGFAIWNKGTLWFREASSNEGRVVDVPLEDYLRNALKSPTIKGINVQVALPR